MNNLQIKTSKSENTISKNQSEISPILPAGMGNKTSSFVEDYGIIKSLESTTVHHNELRKDTNLSSYSLNTPIKKTVFNASIGRIQDGIVILVSDDFNLIELPISLLPKEIRKGNIFKIEIERNVTEEELRKENILKVQKKILESIKY